MMNGFEIRVSEILAMKPGDENCLVTLQAVDDLRSRIQAQLKLFLPH